MDQESDYGPAPKRRGLRTGFTTGACAAAATRAACLALMEAAPPAVEIPLPVGYPAIFAIHSLVASRTRARASVIKDAGDDPDVTHRAEIGVIVQLRQRPLRGIGSEWSVVRRGSVARSLGTGTTIELRAGPGVGVVTRPGLGLPVGGPAINPVPRRMISRAVRETLTALPPCVRVAVWVRDGEALARRTFNGRLGITGGLSILGTTGVVRPYSTAAWKASVLQGIDVAAALGLTEVVASTGGRSEKFAKAVRRDLPQAAFVEMGEFTGHVLMRARDRGIAQVTLSGMIGKLSKIACGHFMTHAAGNQVDPKYLASVSRRSGNNGGLSDAISESNSARHVQELVQAAGVSTFFDLVCSDVREACTKLVGPQPDVEVLLFDFDGKLLGRTPNGERP